MNTHLTYSDGVTHMSSEERITRSLDGTLPSDVPALPVGQIDRVTRARIRHSMAELAAGQIENVNRWLTELGATNPRAAIECYIELLQFSLPKVKAVAVDVRAKPGALSGLSMAELASIVSEQ